MSQPELVALFTELKKLGALHVTVTLGDQRFEVTFNQDDESDPYEGLS